MAGRNRQIGGGKKAPIAERSVFYDYAHKTTFTPILILYSALESLLGKSGLQLMNEVVESKKLSGSINAEEQARRIKEVAINAGIDVIGIAPVERWDDFFDSTTS